MRQYVWLVSCITLFSLRFAVTSKGQIPNTYNINADNGLSDNHIYNTIVDKYGYLWICTSKGVVKYNGYTTKSFNQSAGIANEDVWNLVEDRKGRIWISNISTEYGYLHNNKYYTTAIDNNNNTVYPKNTSLAGDNIVFFSNYVNGKNGLSLCVEKNDSILYYNINKLLGVHDNDLGLLNWIFFTEGGAPVILYRDCYYKIVDNYSRAEKVRERSAENKRIVVDNYLKAPIIPLLRNKYLIHNKDSEAFHILNLLSDETQTFKVGDWQIKEKANFIFPIVDSTFAIITDHYILQLDYKVNLKKRAAYQINELIADTAVSGKKIFSFLSNKLWNNCIGTITDGLFINYASENRFCKKKTDLTGYKYVGMYQDSTTIWWNETSHTLSSVTGDRMELFYKNNELKSLHFIQPYCGDTLLISGEYLYHYIIHSKQLIPLNEKYGTHLYADIVDDKYRHFIINMNHFYELTIKDTVVNATVFNRDRYDHLVYDHTRGNYWAYNREKIFIHGRANDTIITKNGIAQLGIKKIEQIAFDKEYGNIILKGVDNIVSYDPERKKGTAHFKNINLIGAGFLLKDSTIIVYGKFGVLFSIISGKEKLSAPLMYPNIKNINYKYIYDCAIAGKSILIQTDKGTYGIPIPTRKEILTAPEHTTAYRFIISYADTTLATGGDDTINISQHVNNMRFDIVNPVGNGELKYVYKFATDSAWTELNANELSLPQNIAPDNYYTLQIKANDDVWRSDNVTLTLYIIPHWWQSATGKKIVWVSIGLLIIVLLMSLVLITRRMVLKANRTKHVRMELELKAIYAQLNPHFIFNTLNSALFLVSKNEMEEAYAHIIKFSRLLRSYIKSSRNKLISLADEIKNMEDYIELQQTRFDQKFSYQINVAAHIDTRNLIIPSLLLQPFVENAIDHGILPMKTKGNLSITFQTLGDKELMCVVEDDGVGRKEAAQITNSKKEGNYGNLLIKDLVTFFNNYDKMNITIAYTDKELPLTGTIVTIHIKNPHYGTSI